MYHHPTRKDRFDNLTIPEIIRLERLDLYIRLNKRDRYGEGDVCVECGATLLAGGQCQDCLDERDTLRIKASKKEQ